MEGIKVHLFFVLLIGIGLGWIGFLLFGDIADQCQIVYISQREMLDLERARVEQEKEQDLFFGKIDQALQYINEQAIRFKNRRTKVIFTKERPISVDDEPVISISDKMHQQIISRLKLDSTP